MKILAYILFMISPIIIMGQSAIFKAKADTNKLLLGEETTVNYEITFPASIDPQTVNFPDLSDTLALGNKWEIRKKYPKKNSSYNKNGEVYLKLSQKITIANFDSGKYELPPKIASIGSDSIYSNTLSIDVNPVKIKSDNEIKEIKNIKTDPFTFWEKILLKLKAIYNWIIENWIIIISILAAIVLFVYLFIKLKNKKVKEVTASKIPIPIQLLKKLELLKEEKLWQNGKYKLYFTKIDEILWEYIEYKFKTPTFEKTSNEILNELKLTSIPLADLSQLEKLFNISNMVKFAKQIPNQQENEFAMKFSRSFIEKELESELVSEPAHND